MARGSFILVAALALAACEHEPMEYIPPADRAMLQAQARMGEAGSAARPVTVDEMLARAKASSAGGTAKTQGGTPAPLVLQFSAGAVQPDEAQKQSLTGFATAARGRPIAVIARPSAPGGETALLGQRRAMAVARALQPSVPDVDLKFTPDAPPDVVVVRLESGDMQRATP